MNSLKRFSPKVFLWGELNREMCKCSLGSAKTKSVLSFLFQDLYLFRNLISQPLFCMSLTTFIHTICKY